jgi:hypothetical protein
MKTLVGLLLAATIVFTGCATQAPAIQPTDTEVDRENKIPVGQIKITPQTDYYPPKMHSAEYSQPVPLPYPINTAGAEDSAFMMPDGSTLYVWFTPNPNAPLSQQLDEGVTGIYVLTKKDGQWQQPERLMLQDPGKQALDGCVFVQGNTIWFCSARTGYTGMSWFTAVYVKGRWSNWQKADFDVSYEIGELHITADGSELYFHSSRAGGKGQYDIWVSRQVNGKWQEPQNLAIVNSSEVEGWPFVTADGNELWFTRIYLGSPAIFRSKKVNGQWQEPELIISQFAGEPSVDNQGNIYFTHHFYKDGVMLEADIYVAYKVPS